MLARSFLIESSSKLLVTRTGIKARLSLISGRITVLTLELLAIEWRKFYTFELEYLWGQLANLDQGGERLRVGKGCIMFWGGRKYLVIAKRFLVITRWFLVYSRKYLVISKRFLVITRRFLVYSRKYLVISKRFLVITRWFIVYWRKHIVVSRRFFVITIWFLVYSRKYLVITKRFLVITRWILVYSRILFQIKPDNKRLFHE